MKKNITFAMAIISAIILTGCASAINGNQTEVTITTDVPAQVAMYDYANKLYHEGETPLTISLPHRSINTKASEFWLHFTEKDDPKNNKKFFIKANTCGWFFGNLLFIHPIPVIIGFCVDLDSDSRYCFDKTYHFDLKPKTKK